MLFVKILRRILSNIVDLIVFFFIYVCLTTYYGNARNFDIAQYLMFVSFVIGIAIPVLTTKNTIGKHIFKLSWEQPKYLWIKYAIYFCLYTPFISFTSLFTNFPYFQLGQNKPFILGVTITFVILDCLIFIFSLGKYHILDYFFNFQIIGLQYKKNELKSLSIFNLFWCIFLLMNFALLKNDLSFKKVHDLIVGEFYYENFPEDQFYGKAPIVIRQKSSAVFICSDMLSFLFNKEYNQKILYLDLPYSIFSSEKERFEVCKNLLFQSITNDIYLAHSVDQTKIVLKSVHYGKYGDYSSYSYTYYYDNGESSPKWGIYGGIKNDSLTVDKYFNFIKNLPPIKSNVINIQSSKSQNDFTINIVQDSLKFEKLQFKDVEPQGFWNLNFPPQYMMFQTHYWNILDSQAPTPNDENIYWLLISRNASTAKYL